MEFETTAEACSIAGCNSLDGVVDTSAVDRESQYKALIEERPAWGRTIGKILGSKAPPIEPKVEATSSKEVDIFAKLEARDLFFGK